MIRNYLKTALRNLWRNRTYGLLNILGLAVGITCAALIFIWVEDEVSFNHNHEKMDRLFVVMNNQTYDDKTYTFWATPGPLAKALKAEVPGVARAGRMYWGADNLFSAAGGAQEKAIYETGNYVDPEVFQMFTVRFLKGRAEQPFSGPTSIVITKRMAEKFFGTEDPMGKILKMNNTFDYTVTGVIEEQPANSTFRSDWFTPFEAFSKGQDWMSHWGSNGMMTVVELEPNADLDRIQQTVHGFIKSKEKDAESTSFLFNLSEWHLYSQFENGVQTGGLIVYVRLFTIVACFILLIACINFMNLATARSEKRAREVGMRKVLGGTKGMLIGQFIGESLVLSFISVLFAVLFIYLAMPFFNQLVEKKLSLDMLSPVHVGGLLAIGLITGLLAGSYPSFYLSSFAPVAVLKGLRINTDSGAGFIRKGLVVFQFSISIMLIVGTVIVYQQVNYVKARNLGYDKERLIYLTLADKSPERFNTIRNELLNTGLVEDAAQSSSTVLNLGSNGGGWSWPGKDPTKDVLITQEYVSAGYVPTMGMKLLAGRNFRDPKTDTLNIIINETLAKMIGKGKIDVVGTLVTRDSERYQVVGVISDFIFNNFYTGPEPIMMYCQPLYGTFLTIRMKPTADLPKALAQIGGVMKTANPGFPFEYKFVDEEFERNFKGESLIGKLAGVFAGLAILISCLGLFGLAAYTAERRTREIGIRKVLGASMQSVVQLLSKDFLQLVSISCLVAFPLAWWALKTWLDDYAYRTPIHWWVFGVAGAAALAIALCTVSFQAIKAAVANPVKSLRTE